MLIDGRFDATSRRSSRSIRQSLSLTILMENRWKIGRKSLSNLVLHQIRLENRSWERFCLHFTLWGVLLGAPGTPWATLGAPLGDLWALQGCPGSLLGVPRGSLGTLQGPTWDPPGLPWASPRHSKRCPIRKSFSNFEVAGRLGSPGSLGSPVEFNREPVEFNRLLVEFNWLAVEFNREPVEFNREPREPREPRELMSH